VTGRRRALGTGVPPGRRAHLTGTTLTRASEHAEEPRKE